MGEGSSSSLPTGFRFLPSEEALVAHFLYHKAALLPFHPDIIPTIDLHRCCDPWSITGEAFEGGNRLWYFFTSSTEGEAFEGGNRLWYFFTSSTEGRASDQKGYWETEAECIWVIRSGDKDVGVKKTHHYYTWKARETGVRTNWVMHQYHLLDSPPPPSILTGESSSSSSSACPRRKRRTTDFINKWIICRVHESGGRDGDSPTSLHAEGVGVELSCLDEVFLSLDDLDEVSLMPDPS